MATSSLSGWEKWKRRPQIVRLRKALFQVHLWTGIGVGLYILLMSVSGSAVVFRRELAKYFGAEPRVAAGPGPRMSEADLKQIAQRAFPDYDVTHVSLRKNPDQAAEIYLEGHGKVFQRLYNPYTGADLGDPLRFGFRAILWVVDLHDNLLLANTGRRINAFGAVCTLLLGLTGAVIWWPGVDTWRRNLSFRWKANPKGFNWTLHSALGFWTLGFFLMWAISGIYLSIPKQFAILVDYLEPAGPGSRNLRLGDNLLYWLTQAHFGRFDGIGIKIIWTVVGLAPAVLFVTGMVMWWNRVLVPWRRRMAAVSPGRHAARAPRSEDSIQAGS